jgi:hypothetical protein
MNLILLFISLTLIAIVKSTNEWECSKTEAIASFKKKTLINQYPQFKNDPYKNQTTDSMSEIIKTLADQNLVCAIKYTDDSKSSYTIRNFPNENESKLNDHIITHQGKI